MGQTCSCSIDHDSINHEFYAIAPNKCGNDTLLFFKDYGCPGMNRGWKIGETQTCFVSRCDKQEFRFHKMTDPQKQNKFLRSGGWYWSLGVGLHIWFVGLCCCCCNVFFCGEIGQQFDNQ